MAQKMIVRAIVTIAVTLGVGALVAGISGCKTPEPRPSGNSFEGSAFWALQIAQPVINNFSSDAQLYQVLGSFVWKDGRLPGNTGSWSFVTWSSSLKKKCQVTISAAGSVTKSITDSQNPPSSGSNGVIPSGWVNSTVIFGAIPAVEVTDNYAQLVVFNMASYPEAPHTAVWGVNFASGNNPLIKWDGQYIGTQN